MTSQTPTVWITLRDVRVDLGGVTILDQVSLEVRERDFLGIIGPNGGGKTTLLKVMLGLITPVSGRVETFGGSAARGRKHIGYVPQAANIDRQFPITVMEVVLMGRLSRLKKFQRFGAEDRRIAEQVLRKVDMWEERGRQVGQLSGGERQRVFIARALATRPRVLLLDEPTSNVDSRMQAGIYELLKQLKEEGTAIVLVTHDLSVISKHVDKIACLNGRLYYHDSKEITRETLETVYGCPVDLIAHGVPHRVLEDHDGHAGCEH